MSKFVEDFPSVTQTSAPDEHLSESAWTKNVDWEKVRTEYLSGVSLNVIHDELFESGRVPVQYLGFWKQTNKRIALSEATMVRIFKPAERIEIDYADGIDKHRVMALTQTIGQVRLL